MKNRVLQLLIDKDSQPTYVGWPSEAFAYFLQLTADASTGRQAL